LSTAARIAGVLMIINGILLVAQRQSPGLASAAASAGIFPMFVSFIVGGLVAAGSTRAATLALVFSFLGVAFLPLAMLGRGQQLLALLQVCYSAGLILLLFRRAPRWRAIIGVTLVMGPFVMQSFGLYGIQSGRFPLARLLSGSDLVDLASGPVPGAKFQYVIDNPGKAWYRRSEASITKEKTAADLWLMRPDRDAHVMVIPEALPANMTLDMDRFQDAVLKNYAAYFFVVQDQTPLRVDVGEARLLRGKGRMPTGELDFMIVLYVQLPYVAQVTGFGPSASFGDVSEDVLRVVQSLRF
jgi:hypothetical protein